MADVPNPVFDSNGNPFSGAVLKAFLPGGTTSTSIAIDSDGSSPQASITYNAQGKLEVSGNEILPYIDRKHKWGIFANAADATANTPFYMGPFDAIFPVIDTKQKVIKSFDTHALAIADTGLVDGDSVETIERSTGDGGGSTHTVVETSTVVPNTFNIAVLDNKPELSLVLNQNPNNSIDMYGAAGGVNSSSAMAAAIAVHVGELKAEKSGYILDALVDFASGPCTGMKGVGRVDCIFVKAVNGDVMTINNQASTFSKFWIQGDGANFTGGGFKVVSDDCVIENIRVTDTADSCIICKADASKSLRVDDAFLQPTDLTTTHSIRGDGVDLSPSPTARVFNQIIGGSSLVDFSGMNRAILSNSFGTTFAFDANSSKISVVNNRFTNATGNLTVSGLDHVFTGNIFGFGAGFNLTFDATCAAVTYDDSNKISIDGGSNNTCIDLSPKGNVINTNSIYQPLAGFDFLIEGTTSDSANGNSTATALYSKNGRSINATWSYIKGSTATLAVGAWSLTLPWQANSVAVGSVRLKQSDGTWHDLTMRVFGGSNQAFISFPPSANLTDVNAAPFSINSQIEASISYTSA